MPSVAFSFDKCQKLFNTALHQSTADEEALNAFRLLRRAVANSNQSVHDLRLEIGQPKSQPDFSLLNSSYSEMRASVEAHVRKELEAEVRKEVEGPLRKMISRRERKIKELKEEIAELRKTLKTEPPAPPKNPASSADAVTDTGQRLVAWTKFAEAAQKKFGRTTAWKAVFALEINTEMKTLNAWEVVGLVPEEYLTLLDSFTPAQCEPASRKRWSDDERARLGAMVADGLCDLEIAQRLRNEFGRRLTEGSITGARRRFEIFRKT